MTMERWVSVEQVAQHLGVAKDTVYRWREHRRLPAHRVGRLWKFKLTEVDEWVRAGGADEARNQDSGGKPMSINAADTRCHLIAECAAGARGGPARQNE